MDHKFNFLPHLLPTKLGDVLLLQFILDNKESDKIGLRYIGFAIGIVTLAISLNASTSGFIFKSFSELFTFRADHVQMVRRMAHYINNTLCSIQVILTNFMFFYCLNYYADIDHENKSSKYYVIKQIFLLSFYISGMVFVASVIAVLSVVYLFYIHKPIMKILLNIEDAKLEVKRHLPLTSAYVVEIDLAAVLLVVYIGTDENGVGGSVYLYELALWIGVITVSMVMLDTVVTLALVMTINDGHLDQVELRFFKAIHLIRYLMAIIQVLLFCAMMVQGFIILSKRGSTEGQYQTPDSLLEVSLALSIFVMVGAIYASLVVIYLNC